jgi:hypothetical protein
MDDMLVYMPYAMNAATIWLCYRHAERRIRESEERGHKRRVMMELEIMVLNKKIEDIHGERTSA